jgi:O-antigen/teichoic acid export membrane protein
MLKERLKFLLKDTAIYGIANGISRFVSLLTIPIIVKQLNVSSFGTWNILTVLGSIISAVLIFGMDSAVVRHYYDGESLEHRRRVFSHGLIIQVCLVLLFSLFAALAPDLLLKSVGLDSTYKSALVILSVWIPANVFAQYFQNWFKWTFQRQRFLAVAIGIAIINILLLIVFSRLGELTIGSIIGLQAIATWTLALLALWWCRRFLTAQFELDTIKQFLAYGFPMMLIMVISVLSPTIDRLFLSHMLDERSLGLYSFIQKISVIMVMVVTAFQTAFGPFSFSIWNKEDAPNTFARFQTFYLMGTGVVAIGLACVSKPLILHLGTAEYLGNESYLSFLIVGAIVYGLYSFAAIGIFYSKKMSLNLLALTIGLAVTAGLNSLLVPRLLEAGAAIGFLTGNIAMVVTAYIMSRPHYSIPFSYFKDVIVLVALGCVLLSSTMPFSDNLYLDSLYKVMALVPTFAIFCIGLLSKRERQSLLQAIKQPRSL